MYQRLLGTEHPDTQTVLTNFVGLLRKAITEGCTTDLSDDPLTQALLQHLQSQIEDPE